MQVNILSGVEAFNQASDAWDQLWLNSDSTVAFHRASTISRFVTSFHLDDDFVVILISDRDRLVAGLPLIIAKNRLGQRIGRSLANEWSLQTCLLKTADAAGSVLSKLNDGFKQLKLFQVQLDWIPLHWNSSQQIIQSWNQAHRSVWVKPRFEVSYWSVPSDWNIFWWEHNKKRAKKFASYQKKLGTQGTVSLKEMDGQDPECFVDHLKTAFEIEHSGWKGENGSSIRSNPQIEQYFLENYFDLAQAGLAKLYFLMVGNRPIAFDLGYQVNGVYSSQKVSYLPDYAKFSPGQLLNVFLLEHWSQTQEVQFVDCIGEVNQATLEWGSNTYPSGKITLSTGTIVSNASVYALHNVANWLGKNQLPNSTVS